MKRTLLSLSAVLLTPLVAPAQDFKERQAALSEYVSKLTGEASTDKLRAWHDRLASAPHDAGTPGDRLVVDMLAELFTSFGLEVNKQELEVYIGRPVGSEVWVVEPELIKLATREREIEGDPHTGDQARSGWNAFAGSGDVTAGVVYANFGRLEDFEKLKALGVSCEGKIVIARYGGNYRGYKARYAEAAGAVGVVIYTDPADSGYVKGEMYPEGGWANETSIQRGSLKTLPYMGDPLTPGRPAFPGADRLDPSELETGLPNIPVQPIGWGAASEILSRMTGDEAPEGWKGGLEHAYRLTGGDELEVRLKVEQVRELTQTWNVIGTLRGSERPEELVIIGCHHDAWGYGAGDPTCGLIAVVEAARVFGEMAKQGWRPARSILFAGWGAEEHGIIGSSEFVENARDMLTSRCVAYINLDGASMGPNFNASATPSLWSVIHEAAGEVPNCRDGERSVLDAWVERSGIKEQPGRAWIGELGGGSDHVGFLCHACVPSVSMSCGGSPGVSYHSMYDTLAWYRQVVGDDYEPALMMTRMAAAVAARLGDADAALDPGRYGGEIVRKVGSFEKRIEGGAVFNEAQLAEVGEANARLREAATRFGGLATDLRNLRSEPGMGERDLFRINTMTRVFDTRWCIGDGSHDDRPWYRSLYAAPDATSGYASWTLPGLQNAMHTRDAGRYISEADRLTRILMENVRAIDQVLEVVDP